VSRPSDGESPRSPVTADDVSFAVRLAVRTLGEAPAGAWENKAGSLEWDCWETIEHLSDDLFAYAARMGPASPPLADRVPFACESRRPGGPENTIYVDRAAGPAGLLQALEACGGLLAAMVRTTSPQVRAFHVHGVSDAEGFAAMGVAETLVHMHDVTQGLGLAWNPPADLCTRVLARLFPHAPVTTSPWPTLLWATGRGDFPGLSRLTDWRWYAAPRL
jgi:hypothetical protein